MQQGMTTNKPKPTSFPAEDRTNPYMNMTYESFNTKSLQLSNSYSVCVLIAELQLTLCTRHINKPSPPLQCIQLRTS